MSRPIQSIERAVAVLRVLSAAPHDLALQEVADSLDLAKTTTHGIVATLRHLGLVEQDRRSGLYRAAHAPGWLPQGGVDPHLLRSHAVNWADSLAATTGFAVALAVPSGREVEIVHHVFSPRGPATQSLLYGELRPAHATALGKVLLAFTRWWQARMRQTSLERYTNRTVCDHEELTRQVDVVRRKGYAVALGELRSDLAGVAAPIRAYGGLGVGALGVFGELGRLCPDGRTVDPTVVSRVTAAARAVSEQLELPR